MSLEREVLMSQTVNVNFKLDADVKKSMERACSDMGLSMSAAFTIFAKKVGSERRIPFEVSADPFYSESNMAHLRRGIAALNAGKGSEHEILGEDAE
jgi:addiction module antitoxin, relB/dinJ family